MSPQSNKRRGGGAPADPANESVRSNEGNADAVRPVPAVIGEFLQAHYRDLVDAPVPDHLARLVEMLEQRESGSDAKPASGTGLAADPDDGKGV